MIMISTIVSSNKLAEMEGRNGPWKDKISSLREKKRQKCSVNVNKGW